MTYRLMICLLICTFRHISAMKGKQRICQGSLSAWVDFSSQVSLCPFLSVTHSLTFCHSLSLFRLSFTHIAYLCTCICSDINETETETKSDNMKQDNNMMITPNKHTNKIIKSIFSQGKVKRLWSDITFFFPKEDTLHWNLDLENYSLF